jgi:predicted esterase/catechol 2,3-dioxygenase-like lactoylglutathione lyase family enzyme
MSSEKIIQGIHHITAIAGSATENVAFYENVLGLRLVKQTVNFDDPFTYHLYYGDQEGNPGTILTFFPWQGVSRGKNGRGMVTAIAFEIPLGSFAYWRERLLKYGIDTTSGQRFGEEVIEFSDPHGLRLELIATGKSPATSQFISGCLAPLYPIKGFHSVTSTLKSLQGTRELLEDYLGMELHVQDGKRYRFKMKNDTSTALFYDLLVEPEAEIGRQGSGSVHHIAFRTSDDKEQLLWQRSLLEGGYSVTGVRDRKYFKSIYFHEPGGVLFEIATDPPGFAVDEPVESLGEALQLPKNYEPMRSEIKQNLPPLRPNTFIHEYIEAHSSDNDMTIVALHGTGGDEHDFIPIAQKVGGGAAIISPRGKVNEGGMNRFFARLVSGVFDEKDIIRQADDLAEFLLGAAIRYKRPLDQFAVLGYSNGANIATALLLLRPEVFSRVILLRPMLPFLQPAPIDLSNKEVLILRGTRDTVIPYQSTDQLIQTLINCGAQVDVKDVDAGHELTSQDLQIVSQWFASTVKPHFAP